MLGLELATVPADKVQDPERTINRATLFGTAGAGGIYILVCSAVVLMLPVAITSASAAPFADFVSVYAGTNAGTAIAAIGAISALGALNGWIMCQAELPAALARDGLFPAFMGKAAANGTPRNAHLFSTSLLTLVILMNSSRTMASMFEFLILLTTAIVLVMYFGCAAAAFRLIQTGTLKVGAGFKSHPVAGRYIFLLDDIWRRHRSIALGHCLIARGLSGFLAIAACKGFQSRHRDAYMQSTYKFCRKTDELFH